MERCPCLKVDRQKPRTMQWAIAIGSAYRTVDSGRPDDVGQFIEDFSRRQIRAL